jgi:hypothetical protein
MKWRNQSKGTQSTSQKLQVQEQEENGAPPLPPAKILKGIWKNKVSLSGAPPNQGTAGGI